MGRKKGGVVDEGPGGVSSEEAGDAMDTVDQINRDIGFLMETLRLVQVASLRQEQWRDISLVNVMEEMIVRVERVEKLCNRLRHAGTKEDGKS